MQNPNSQYQPNTSIATTDVDNNATQGVANQNRSKLVPVGLGRGMGRGIKKAPKRHVSSSDHLVGSGGTNPETTPNGWGELIPKTNGDDGTEIWGKSDSPQVYLYKL